MNTELMMKEMFSKLDKISGFTGKENILLRQDDKIVQMSINDLKSSLYETGTQEIVFDGEETSVSVNHTLGSIPSAAFIQFSSQVDSNVAAFTYVPNSTEVIITFENPPNPGSNVVNFTVFK